MLARGHPPRQDAGVQQVIDVRGPHDPCVCGSGREFGLCHRDQVRNQQIANLARPEAERLSRRLLEFAAPIMPP